MTTSYIIVSKETGLAVFETYSATTAANINTDKYRAIPVLEYLRSLNRGQA